MRVSIESLFLCALLTVGAIATTCAAEGPEAGAGVIFRHGGAGCFHDQVGRFGERPCGRPRAGELPAIRAMAVARAVQRPGDLENDASAEAAGLHDRVLLQGLSQSGLWG